MFLENLSTQAHRYVNSDPHHCFSPHKYADAADREQYHKQKRKTHSQNSRDKKSMSSKVVSSAQQSLYLSTKLNKKPIPHRISAISFSSKVSKSKISSRARRPARVVSFYAPPSETAETLYEVLGIAENGSTMSDIKRAYKQMARKYHPDVSPPERVDEYTRRFILVHEAYETLSDPNSRASYDRGLATGFGFAYGKSGPRNQEMKGKEEWKSRWESQLDALKRMGGNRNSCGRTTWGSRMRNQT
ncbi:chaperone protein DNAj [Striga asiatica]|uniref:Chaperone protein DNAj n=1 Tax=Striga asiatica TaxID=4170 RepID=A0A5A7PF91_STRAF|nr:chaperone protein DNAj [Striga asiatica]